MVDLYVHGVPVGHSVWGPGTHRNYIDRFYGVDANISTPQNCYMQIDIAGGDAYYTSVRRGNVFGATSDGKPRPGSFFALTLRFEESYCTNVSLLYKFFETIYNRYCIGTFLKKDGENFHYQVSAFDQAKSGGSSTVDMLQNLFDQNISQTFNPYIVKFAKAPQDTVAKTRYDFSIFDVDSPFFFGKFNEHKLIIANYVSIADSFEKVVRERNTLSAEKASLIEQNTQLDSNIAALKDNVSNLTSQVESTKSSLEKKFEDASKKQKEELKRLKQLTADQQDEIDSYKKQFERVKKSLSSLCELNNSLDIKGTCISTKSQKDNRTQINTLILFTLLILSVITLILIVVSFA